ncbi:peptidase inhibitor family I36 protein [Umezawaea sp. Da 62-37]|uniref:peptidase inhibitor family I36 protein n=1 Tax=Umezawaea sp. Da 62-37 TaxID=3075927 RepID=UPI0028F6E952|nr:peptidase inhibitor family I36 protein [Umezawaea sp. Da 62-37]WNV83759.1 peptidase inhibitor family I36 protein [Umezawaea sp. Da 62-37]
MSTRTLLTALAITTAALVSSGTANAQESDTPKCDPGEFCLWSAPDYTGPTKHFDLETANPGECTPLPAGLIAHSFVNRLTRDASVYQGETCSTEAEFTTYPGRGTYVPNAPFVVRAIQVWEN